MSVLTDLLAEHASLSEQAVAHLKRLASEWQIVADLAFADLTLWVPESSGGYICIGQVRPTTDSTCHPDDMVGDHVSVASSALFERAINGVQADGRIVLGNGVRIDRWLYPVRHDSVVVAVIASDSVARTGSSALETNYRNAASALLEMISDGSFPPRDLPRELHTGPRAGDGMLRLGTDGCVSFASPNALSAYHRLGFAGDMIGADLAKLTRSLVPDTFDGLEVANRITGAVRGQPGLRMEVEAHRSAVLFRAIPLRPAGKPAGALVFVRDVTELRRLDKALISKDATIREVHHRVKNNLQTVAALLRLQSRRSKDPAVRSALAESVRRIDSIALVHEMLSATINEDVDLDAVFDRLLPMLSDVSTHAVPARTVREGSFGLIPADVATPLVMVLTECVQNAQQHAFGSAETRTTGGHITVTARRSAAELAVSVVDDGAGLPPNFSLERTGSLGLQIVRTLVTAELNGSIRMVDRTDGSGTKVTIRVPVTSKWQE